MPDEPQIVHNAANTAYTDEVMAIRPWKATTTASAAVTLREALAERILAHTPRIGANGISIPGTALFRRIATGPCGWTTADPCLTVIAQGRKLISVGSADYQCAPSSFIVYAVDVPVRSHIVEASEESPLLSFGLHLDMQTAPIAHS